MNRIRGSEFVRHNTIYFFGAIIVGALNYLYYPVLGRLLDPAAFGEVQTIVSLFLQVAAFLTVTGIVTIHIVANRESDTQANRTISELERLALYISFGVLVGMTLFSGQLQHYLQFGSAWPFVFLGIATVVTVPYMIRSAYVNGKKLFALNITSSIVAAGTKLLASAALVALGFGTGGAVLGIVIAQVIALCVAIRFAHRHGFRDRVTKHLFQWPDIQRLKPDLQHAGLVLIGSASITVLYSVDIIIAKHYFDPHIAGLYASVASVARILFFLTIPITQVMMPSIKMKADYRDNAKAMLKSLMLLCLIGGCALVVFWAAPQFVVTTLMGQEYFVFAYLLPQLGLAIFIISLLNMLLSYYMILRVYAVGLLAITAVIGTTTWMIWHHDSLSAMVTSLLQGTLAAACMFAFWMGWRSRTVLLTLIRGG